MLFSIVKNPEISANDLYHLDVSRQWKWKLEFYPDPTKQATELGRGFVFLSEI